MHTPMVKLLRCVRLLLVPWLKLEAPAAQGPERPEANGPAVRMEAREAQDLIPCGGSDSWRNALPII